MNGEEEVETVVTDSSSQSQDASRDSSPGHDDKPADSSAAPGDSKEPKSLSEALEKVQLETPVEETTADADKGTEGTQAEESPTTDGKAKTGEAKEDAAGKKDEKTDGKPKADQVTTDAAFDKQPEWRDLMGKLDDKAKAEVRPVLRKLMTREAEAQTLVKQLRPHEATVNELRQFTGDETGFTTMRNIVRAYATDPEAAVPILENMLTDARQRAGMAITSPDLKQRQDQIRQKVKDGTLDADEAEQMEKDLTEVERARAGRKQAETRVQTSQQSQQQRQAEQQAQATATTINSWETSIRERDPDFGQVTDVNDPAHGESIADQVFDAMVLKRINKPNATADDLIAEANRVYRLARGRLAQPPARTTKVAVSQSSSVTAKKKPTNVREAMDSVKLQ